MKLTSSGNALLQGTTHPVCCACVCLPKSPLLFDLDESNGKRSVCSKYCFSAFAPQTDVQTNTDTPGLCAEHLNKTNRWNKEREINKERKKTMPGNDNFHIFCQLFILFVNFRAL